MNRTFGTLFMGGVFLFAALAVTAATESVPKPNGVVDLTSPSGNVTSPMTFYKGSAARAFQDNPNLAGGDSNRVIYDRTKTENAPGRFVYTFDAAKVVNAYGVGIMNDTTQCNGREPRVWKFYGSNDYDGDKAHIADATWVQLDAKNDESEWVGGEYRYFRFANTAAYASYMIAFEEAQTTSSDKYLQFAYLEYFYDDIDPLVAGSLRKVENGNWRADYQLSKGTASVTLELSAPGQTTVVLPSGLIPASSLTDVDKSVGYTATLLATAPSGQVNRKRLLGTYYFGEYSSVKKSDYTRRFVMTVALHDGFAGGANQIVPVKISPTLIQNFSYDDFQEADYSDLAFFDEFGNLLPHEVETWNTSGESLVWVRFPMITNNVTVTCCYDGPSAAIDAKKTWFGYNGVWHLNELTGGSTYANSSPAGSTLDGTKATLSVDGAAGRFGKSCCISSAGVKSGEYSKGGVFVPHSDALGIGSTFTVSGWFKHKNQGYYYDRMFAKRANGGSGGFSVEMANGWTTDGTVQVRAGSTINPKTVWPDKMMSDWAWCTFVFDGRVCSVYQNGTLFWSKTATADMAINDASFTIGNQSLSDVDGTGDCVWCGWIDEVRLTGGVALTPEEIATEYAVTADAELLSYSPAIDVTVELALIVTSNIPGFGEPDPAYGEHESDEGITTVSSGSEVLTNDVIYAANRYTIEVSTDGGLTFSDPVEHTGNSFAYAYDGKITRVTWLWEPYAVPVSISSSHASGQLSYSAEPYKTIGGVRYYLVGSTLMVTATDADASSFREWQDAGPEVSAVGGVATITIGTTPIKMTAVSRHPWIFDNGVLSDGAWSITAKVGNQTELTMSGVTTSPDYGILDLTEGIRSLDGETAYTLVKFENSPFKENGKLRAVYLAPGLLYLGWNTFQTCTNLTTFAPLLPDSLANSNVGQVFDGCSSLTGDVVLTSQALTAWGNKMFAGTKVTSLNAPYLRDISGGETFKSCSALTNVVIPSIVKIGAKSFAYCPALKSVTMGESLEVLGNGAFSECSALTTVTPLLPASLKTFGTSEYKGTLNSGAFGECSSLTGDVRMVNTALRDVYGQTFQNTKIRSLYAPYATNIWKFALNNCPSLERVEFGAESVKNVGYVPISGASASLEVYLPGKPPILDYASGESSFGEKSYIRIYCDPKVDPDGWAAFMSGTSFDQPTAAELDRPDYPGEKNTLGIVISKSSKRYWLVKYRSPLRKRDGFILVVR